MRTREQIIAHTVGIEGGYSNHPSDRGGETMFGITERVARRAGYRGAMRNLSYEWAINIYERLYWKPLSLDAVLPVSAAVAAELFDTGVNGGTGRAAEFLQIALNALNRNGKDYADIKVDRDIGPATLNALNRYFKVRGPQAEPVLLKALNSLQGAFYISIGQTRPANEDFMFGWFANRVSL